MDPESKADEDTTIGTEYHSAKAHHPMVEHADKGSSGSTVVSSLDGDESPRCRRDTTKAGGVSYARVAKLCRALGEELDPDSVVIVVLPNGVVLDKTRPSPRKEDDKTQNRGDRDRREAFVRGARESEVATAKTTGKPCENCLRSRSGKPCRWHGGNRREPEAAEHPEWEIPIAKGTGLPCRKCPASIRKHNRLCHWHR